MSCAIKVEFEGGRYQTYTNLQRVKGKVYVNIQDEINVENIQIKLEGTAETRIVRRVRTSQNNTKRESRTETHDLLYDCDTVFPPDNIKRVTKNKSGFTMTPGQYVYDFNFQLPMNAYCGDPTSAAKFSNMMNSPDERYATINSSRAQRIQQQHNQNGFNRPADNVFHQLCPLPPSTHGGTSMREGFFIEYFLKVTVRRNSMIKPNIREIIPLNFTTCDPDELTIARYNQTTSELNNRSKKYIISKEIEVPKPKPNPAEVAALPEKKSFFSRFSSSVSSTTQKISRDIPVFVDIRFAGKTIYQHQRPAIKMFLVTPMPPSLFISPETGKSNELGVIFIEKLIITLIRSVQYRALNFNDTMARTFTLRRLERAAKIDLANTTKNHEGLYEIEFPKELFEKMAVPNNEFPPSFQTCNITNSYTLRIQTSLKGSDQYALRTQKVDFTTDVWVLSGNPLPFHLAPVAPPAPGYSDHQFLSPNGPPPEAAANPPQHPPPGTTPDADSIPIVQDNQPHSDTDVLPSYSEATSAVR